jgi:N-acetylmuramoyl-L-alanine amidase
MPGNSVKRKTRSNAPVANAPVAKAPPARSLARKIVSRKSPRPAVVRNKPAPSRSKPPALSGGTQRKLLVFASLIAALTLTSALLHALAPAPVPPGAVQSLFAVGTSDSMDAIYSAEALQPGRWNYIYIHQSKTESGNAATLGDLPGGLADHFLIGNGQGCHDGEVQIGQRWIDQSPPAAPPGRSLPTDCISICLVGDLDAEAPTAMQQHRLIQLLASLQSRTNIPASHIIALDGDPSAAGIGQRFPATAIRQQLADRP